MRENIGLFRAKRVDNGEWVEGNLIKNEDKCIIALKCESTVDYCGECDRPFDKSFEVNPETVCEFTGFTDKNGNDIFENVEVDFYGYHCVVVFERGTFGLASIVCFDYDELEKIVEKETDNYYNGVFNDNFISLYEIYSNFNCEDNHFNNIEVIGNCFDLEVSDVKN